MYLPKLKALILATLAFAALQPINAQQIRKLTIEEAVELGMKYNKQIKIDQTKVGVSNTKYKQELGLLAPNVAINSSVTRNSPNLPYITGVKLFGPNAPAQTFDATSYNYFLNRLNISQVVFAGLRGWNTLAINKDQVNASRYDLASDKLNTRNNIIVAYYNHYKLIESKKVVDENVKVLAQRLKDAKNLQTTGIALKNDVLKVELSLSTLNQSADEVQSAIDVSNYNLDIMLGLPDTTKIEIVDDGLINTKPEFDITWGVKSALTKRPEIKAADVRLGISNKQLKIARGLYSPVISGAFNFYYDKPNQREFLEPEVLFHNSWDIGVRLSWNITGLATNQFQTQEAKLNIQQAEAQHEQLTDNIKMEVNANYAAYKLALEKIQLNQQSVNQARENRRMTKDQYDNGIKNITDMLDADNLVTVSEINMLSAKIDAEIAYAKLLKSTAN